LRTQKNLVAFATVVLVIFAIVSSASTINSAEASPVQWQQSLKGAVGRSVIQTSDGGYLILGADRSTGYGTASDLPLVGLTFLLIRADDLGNVLWEKDLRIGGSDTNFNCFISTSMGIALAGASFNTIYLVSADLEGNFQ
jgi:hypothetical protein